MTFTRPSFLSAFTTEVKTTKTHNRHEKKVRHLMLCYTANLKPYFKTAVRAVGVISDDKYEGEKTSDQCTFTLTLAESVH